MAKIPDEVRRAVEEVVREHATPAEAIPAAIEAVRALPCFKQLVNALVDNCIQTLVYACRHQSTTRAKREAGEYGGPAKVNPFTSEDVQEVYSFYDSFHINKTTLRNVRMCDLPNIIDTELGWENGHRKNREFATWLWSKAKGPTDERTVPDVVPEAKAKAAWKRLTKKFEGAPAA